MVNIKNQQLKAYILLESLIALGLLATIVSLILTQINHSQEVLAKSLHDQEVLAVATMAVQTKQSQLSLNGVTVEVRRSEKEIAISEGGREVLKLERD